MIFTKALEVILSFFSSIFDSFNLSFSYQSFMGGLDVFSYGVFVLGPSLYTALMTAFIGFYVFKLIYAIVTFLWRMLPLT